MYLITQNYYITLMNNKTKKTKDNKTDKQNTINKQIADPKHISNFILGEKLGEGTFGKVRKATHILTGEKVAVKILEKSRILEKADKIRVEREIKILKMLKHKHIIQLYSVIQAKTTIYLVMELSSGKELFEHIVKKKRLDEYEASKFFSQIISSVDYLHKIHICHRDLKPENLLLNGDSGLKIVDFGLSNIMTKPNSNNTISFLSTACGSPCYAAPEMLEGIKYDGRGADIWSCGIILYAMVCGYLPFEDKNNDVLYKKIKDGKFAVPSFVSEGCKDLIKQILITNPLKRIKLSDIVKHSWFNICNPSLTEGLITSEYNIPIDEDILCEMEDYDFNKEEIKTNVLTNKHNQFTTTYYLLVKKKNKKGDDSISDFKSILFYNFLKDNKNKIKSNTNDFKVEINQIDSNIKANDSELTKSNNIDTSINVINQSLNNISNKVQSNRSNSLVQNITTKNNVNSLKNKSNKAVESNLTSKKNSTKFINDKNIISPNNSNLNTISANSQSIVANNTLDTSNNQFIQANINANISFNKNNEIDKQFIKNNKNNFNFKKSNTINNDTYNKDLKVNSNTFIKNNNNFVINKESPTTSYIENSDFEFSPEPRKINCKSSLDNNTNCINIKAVNNNTNLLNTINNKTLSYRSENSNNDNNCLKMLNTNVLNSTQSNDTNNNCINSIKLNCNSVANQNSCNFNNEFNTENKSNTTDINNTPNNKKLSTKRKVIIDNKAKSNKISNVSKINSKKQSLKNLNEESKIIKQFSSPVKENVLLQSENNNFSNTVTDRNTLKLNYLSTTSNQTVATNSKHNIVLNSSDQKKVHNNKSKSLSSTSKKISYKNTAKSKTKYQKSKNIGLDSNGNSKNTKKIDLYNSNTNRYNNKLYILPPTNNRIKSVQKPTTTFNKLIELTTKDFKQKQIGEFGNFKIFKSNQNYATYNKEGGYNKNINNSILNNKINSESKNYQDYNKKYVDNNIKTIKNDNPQYNNSNINFQPRDISFLFLMEKDLFIDRIKSILRKNQIMYVIRVSFV